MLNKILVMFFLNKFAASSVLLFRLGSYGLFQFVWLMSSYAVHYDKVISIFIGLDEAFPVLI